MTRGRSRLATEAVGRLTETTTHVTMKLDIETTSRARLVTRYHQVIPLETGETGKIGLTTG